MRTVKGLGSGGAAEKVAPFNIWGLEGRPIYYIL